MLRSRVIEFPSESTATVSDLVSSWRIEDYKMKELKLQMELNENLEEFQQINIREDMPNVNKSPSDASPKDSNQSEKTDDDDLLPGNDLMKFVTQSKRVKKLVSKANEAKHRNLAILLARYSSSADYHPNTMEIHSVQTFISISDSEDSQVCSYSIIGLSNISSDDRIRCMLMEANVILKVTNILPYIHGHKGVKATAILFYYFSCDSDIEDRIYSAAVGTLKENRQSNDPELCLITLYTLNNLLPCLDRQGATEIMFQIISPQLEIIENTNECDGQLLLTFTKILDNSSKFLNNHETLMRLTLLGIIRQICNITTITMTPERNGKWTAML